MMAEADVEGVDGKVLEYCDIESKKKGSKKSLGEMEADFLNAMQSFYYDKKAAMSNEEFDILKEELTWEGSKVVVLSSDEQRFLEASMAFSAGKPVLSDAEYDALKLQLKTQGSSVAAEGPRCSLRSKATVADASTDYLFVTSLYVPAVLLALLGVFSIDDLTGFELTKEMELPEPFSSATQLLVASASAWAAYKLTSLVLGPGSTILSGPCPNCGVKQSAFFGDLLGVAGSRESVTVKCTCGRGLAFDAGKRLITLQPPEEPKPPPKARPAAKAKAAAAVDGAA